MKKLRPLSERTYGYHVRKFLRWLGGKEPTRELALKYLEELEKEGKSRNTLGVARNALKREFGFDLPSYKMEFKEPKYLDVETVRKLVEKAPTLLEKTIITLLFDTGCRLGEILGLTVDDIEWDTGVITVERKGGRRERVKVSPKGMEALREWLARRQSKDRRVFMDHDYQSIYYRLRKFSREVGIRFTPHMLRHSRVVHLLKSGVPLERVSDIVGHTKLETTAKIYGRFRAEDLAPYLKEW